MELTKQRQTIATLSNELKMARKQSEISKMATKAEPGWNDIEGKFQRVVEEEYSLRCEAEKQNGELKHKLAKGSTLDTRQFAKLGNIK